MKKPANSNEMITNSHSWIFQTPKASEEMVTIQEEPAIHADFGQSVIPTDTQDIYQASEDTQDERS
ncbi:unnamed protein product, partial [Aphanomyces euteiches]